MDLMTLITKSPYWLRNVGGSFSVFSHAGVGASKNTQEFLFFQLSSVFIVQQRNAGPHKNYLCHQEYCNLKVACSPLDLQRSNPYKLFLLMKPGGVGSCVHLLKLN